MHLCEALNEGSILTIYVCMYMLATLADFWLAAQVSLAMRPAQDLQLWRSEDRQACGAELEQPYVWS